MADVAQPAAGELLARVIDIAEHVDVHEFLFEQGITDGLPVVPPTRERVLEMLSATSRDPQDVVAEVPPNYGDATIEKIAINAVMAGLPAGVLPDGAGRNAGGAARPRR